MDPLYRVGDRLELISMPDDPCPVAAGTLGTVTKDSVDLRDGTWQTSMKWDNGRTLAIISPPDKVKLVVTVEE